MDFLGSLISWPIGFTISVLEWLIFLEIIVIIFVTTGGALLALVILVGGPSVLQAGQKHTWQKHIWVRLVSYLYLMLFIWFLYDGPGSVPYLLPGRQL